MLVLSRKKNESIMIGDDIEIVVIEIKGDQIKLGVKAPRNVTVHRAEVYEEIRAENRKAATTPKQLTGLGSLFSQFKKK